MSKSDFGNQELPELRKRNCGSTNFSVQRTKKLTGMWLKRMGEDYGQETVGVLCRDCAFKMCDDGKVSLGFGGGLLGNLDNWEAVLT